MTTETETTETTTATLLIDADTYVERGLHGSASDRVWADTFAALGGERATITPAWRHGLSERVMVVDFAGTPAALAFVEAGL